jgi:hypothetical protein
MNRPHDLHQQQGYDLMGAAFEVYNELGQGFLEGSPMTKIYQADLIVAGEIVVELKAVRTFASEHEAQLINYLRATRKRAGHLINFGSFPKLEWKRLVLGN